MSKDIDEKFVKNIERLLSPQPCLSLNIFDLNGNIRESVRQQILLRVEAMFKRTLGNLPGISLREAYLCGSSASYFWKEDSDIDIWLDVDIDKSKFFIQNLRKSKTFLNRYISVDRVTNKKLFGIGNIFLDIKVCTPKIKKMHGVYSLMKNSWYIMPRQDLVAGINPQELYDTAVARKEQIGQYIKKISRDQQGHIREGELRKFAAYYDRLVSKQYQSIFEYLILKLLNSEQATVNLQRFYLSEITKTLSILSSVLTTKID